MSEPLSAYSEEKRKEGAVYRTEHFEALPYGEGTYCVVHRDSEGHFASGRAFPAEAAFSVVEAMETAFQFGAKAAIQAIEKGLPQFLKNRDESLTRSSPRPETFPKREPDKA